MSELPKCCPSCSADLRPDGSCSRCRPPAPEPRVSGSSDAPPSRGVKVTLDLTQLLEDGKITRQEYDRLLALSLKDTKVHSFSIFKTLAVIAVAAGTVGLFPELFTSLGEALLQIFGARGLHLMVVVLCGFGAFRVDSGFLAAMCALTILTFLGDAGIFYSHAAYFVAISEPALTVVFFTALAYASYALTSELPPKRQRLAVVFSRTCIFIVNMAFWTGSLWGSKFAGANVPDAVFALGWAAALAAAGTWAAARDKRWVVNTTAVFGSIHFYTQWFERLGASPGSLLLAGIAALGILYGLRQYNRETA